MREKKRDDDQGQSRWVVKVTLQWQGRGNLSRNLILDFTVDGKVACENQTLGFRLKEKTCLEPL